MSITDPGRPHWVLILIGALAVAAPLQMVARSCVESTVEWIAMESREMTLVDETGATLSFHAKIADDGRERAAGFQHMCPQVIAKMPIVFLFGGAYRPAFHMRNVHHALDIAFIADDGRIDEIRRMDPYVVGALKQPVYQPRIPVYAAIEAHTGFFDEQGVVAGAWRLVLPD